MHSVATESVHYTPTTVTALELTLIEIGKQSLCEFQMVPYISRSQVVGSYLSAPTASLLVRSIQTILTGVASLVEGKALSTGSALELMSTVAKGMVHYFSNFPLIVTYKKSCWSPNATLHLKVSLWGQCQERTPSPLEKSSISGRKIFITREKTK